MAEGRAPGFSNALEAKKTLVIGGGGGGIGRATTRKLAAAGSAVAVADALRSTAARASA
jgi:3-oxoacyl-[acyl-carrier protein] reductase